MSSFLFVDSRVQDIDTLLAGLGEDVQVVLLEARSDGIEQIDRALSGIHNLDATHLVSHGSAGTLYLGSTVLTEKTLDAYQTELSQIGASLAEDGDLLLYGCNVGEELQGRVSSRLSPTTPARTWRPPPTTLAARPGASRTMT